MCAYMNEVLLHETRARTTVCCCCIDLRKLPLDTGKLPRDAFLYVFYNVLNIITEPSAVLQGAAGGCGAGIHVKRGSYKRPN